MDPFPAHHRIFFGVVEPAMTVGGAIWASSSPSHYHASLVPRSFHFTPPASLTPVATKMAVRQLGSCYGLLALVAMLLLPTLTSQLHKPATYEQLRSILRAYFLALAIADLTHIAYTFVDLGVDKLPRVGEYNSLMFGNTLVVVWLFAWRAWWFLECGRSPRHKTE